MNGTNSTQQMHQSKVTQKKNENGKWKVTDMEGTQGVDKERSEIWIQVEIVQK